MKMKAAYFLSHPIQYQAPLLRHLAAEGVNITTVYGDISTAGTYFDPDYQQEVSWEQPLLEGYEFEVLRAPLIRASPWGWARVAREWMKRHRPDVVWVHGWGTVFAVGALLAAHACGVPVMLRGETHLRCLKGSWLWHQLHRAVLARVFTQVDHFLAIGSANREFYRAYGVEEARITPVPYVTDNAHFQAACARARTSRDAFRTRLGVAPGKLVLLFVGRLSREKDIPTLLEALRIAGKDLSPAARPCLLIGGEGPLSAPLRRDVAAMAEIDARFLGFVKQSQLPALYDLCDALVLPSRTEPWGMVVNEAMNAGRPMILSDRVGAGADLLQHGESGFVFPSGNAEALAACIRRLIDDPAFRLKAGGRSLEIINRWNTGLAVAGVKRALENVTRAAGGDASTWSAAARTARGGIELAYIGVHEVFQLAIAAHEMGELRGFQCSVIDLPGKLGRAAGHMMRLPSARPLGTEALPPDRVTERPASLLALRAWHWLRGRRKLDPLRCHQLFEHLAARRLAGSAASIAVGAETCALGWFEAAKRRGMKCVLDAHGIPAPFLDAAKRRAAADFGLATPAQSDSEEMTWHKKQERQLADVILVCSQLQKDVYGRLGEDTSRMRPVPLWIDTEFWRETRARGKATLPLRVMFAGTATLAKGLPYLFQALEKTGDAVHLTIVGPLAPDIRHLAARIKPVLTVLGYKSREELRGFYSTQHVLVLPSLGDSFGFVVMEAMACGLPVILTDHCGAPVPDESWRVPAHDSQALAERLLWYAADMTRVEHDGGIAREFASRFPPSEYRRKARAIFAELLAA